MKSIALVALRFVKSEFWHVRYDLLYEGFDC